MEENKTMTIAECQVDTIKHIKGAVYEQNMGRKTSVKIKDGFS